MRCGWFSFFGDDNEEDRHCTEEATHIGDCDMPSVPLCAKHACKRHAVTFAEAERRKELQRVPSHWMAL